MELRLLGAVEAWSTRQRIDLGPPKQRFLLAVLALQINQPVLVDRLVDLTWPQFPPPTAHHAIHVRISKLRAALAQQGEFQVLTRGSAYELRGDPMIVDTHRFRSLLIEARAQPDDAEKMTLYRRALDLWHGSPLADVATPEIVDRLCAGLEEARLVALEECLDAELRLRRHRMVVDEIAQLVAQYPFRQYLVAQLMLTLYRCGRAAEALRTYKVARVRLIDEHGMEPDQSLRKLEQAILRADPALDANEPESDPPLPRVPDAASPVPGVEAIQLSKRFDRVVAVDRVSFSVRSGEITGLVGSSGTGKTTIIRLLSTVLTPSAGTFFIAGTPSSEPVEIRRIVGVLPEGARQPPRMTGREYLTYHARLFGFGRADAARRADRLLDLVGLSERAGVCIVTYSSEMRRRLELARALVNDPAVMLLDEPTAGLEIDERQRLLGLVRDIATERGTTVLFSTRNLFEVERIHSNVVTLDPAGLPGALAATAGSGMRESR